MSPLRIAKGIVRQALYLSGVLGLFHRIRNRHALTVLMFHRVLPAGSPELEHAEREFAFTVDGFGHVLDFARRHYNVVNAHALARAARGEGALPPCPLLITFDDGWRDTVLHAMPELQRRGLPALLFVATEAVADDAGERWWQDALVQAMSTQEGRRGLCVAAGWPAEHAGQNGIEQRLSGWVGGLPPAQRKMVIEAAVPGAWSSVAGRQMLTQSDLKAWLDAGFDLGGHGHMHVPLTLAVDADAELRHSFAHLQRWAVGSRSMSFPHGAMSTSLVQAAKHAGFDLLFSSAAELVPMGVAVPPALGRIHVPENEWTCENGRVSPARLATFLFARPMASGHA